MQQVGVVIHLAKSGRMIIKVDRRLESGTVLFDSENSKFAKVVELIGPVNSPYVTAVPLNRNRVIRGQKVLV